MCSYRNWPERYCKTCQSLRIFLGIIHCDVACTPAVSPIIAMDRAPMFTSDAGHRLSLPEVLQMWALLEPIPVDRESPERPTMAASRPVLAAVRRYPSPLFHAKGVCCLSNTYPTTLETICVLCRIAGLPCLAKSTPPKRSLAVRYRLPSRLALNGHQIFHTDWRIRRVLQGY
jgi:hypothetical protein